MKKKYFLLLSIASLVLNLFTSTFTYALEEGDFSSNEVLFYTHSGGVCTDSTTGSLTGSVNEEKIWHWLIDKGMSEFGAAGIMGNLSVESGFNPFRLELDDETYETLVNTTASNKAFGLAQWDGSRRPEILKTIANHDGSYKKFIAKKYGDEADSYKEAEKEQPGITDKFITIEMDFLYKESTPGGNRSTTWDAMLTATNPRDAADKFEEIFEGSVRGAGGTHSTEADRIYNKYSTGSSGSVGLFRTETSPGCGSSGNTIVGEGGLSEDQAKKFMMNYGANKNGDSAKQTGANWDNCNGGGSNCVTFSQFFFNKFSTEPDRWSMGNGVDVVSNMRADGIPTGKTPKVFSIFSWPGGSDGYGHTGVVLGIHGDTVIVGHASCGSSGIGEGNGTEAGGGAGFIRVGKLNDPNVWLGNVPTEFAYPRGINISEIEAYVNQ